MLSGSLSRRCRLRCIAILLLVNLVFHGHIAANFISTTLRGQVRCHATDPKAVSVPEPTGPTGSKMERKDVADSNDKPLSYYAGMLTNPPSEEDSEKDMITPTLKFVGYGAIFGVAYLALFIGLNSPGAP
eukprot:Skav226648  [mRNA]  locus=scaffold1:85537:85926:- [translate_table: standard]